MSTTAPMFLELEQEEREQALQAQAQELQIDNIDQKQTDKQSNLLGNKVLLAAEKGKLMNLVHLLDKNPELVNYFDNDGYTPLHRASYGGFKDCAKYLIKCGADIESKTSDNWTPLHCAVRWNNVDVAELLIRNGANVNARSLDCDYSIKNDSGDTGFDIARRSGPFYKLWVGVMTIPPELDSAA